MHNKFVVIDERWVWTGSANISDTGTGGYNANAVIILESREAAEIYTREFEQMWSGSYHESKAGAPNSPDQIRVMDTSIEIWFSPQDRAMQFAIRPFITSAKKSLNIAAFFLTDKWVVADIIAAHRRGVEVRILVDATSAQNAYSKHQLLREAGVSVKFENWGGKMHMKAASADRQSLVVGSMNWTSAGNYNNDENTLVVASTIFAAQFDDFFDDMWTSIPDKWAVADSQPESADSPKACSDEIDNDFDGIVDTDPECSSRQLTDSPTFDIVTWEKSRGQHPEELGYQLIESRMP